MDDEARRAATLEAQRVMRETLQNGEHFLPLLQMTDVEVEGVDLTIDMPVTPFVSNSRGGLQGGLIATLIDMAAGRAAMQGVADGHSTATHDMNVHYLAPIVVGPARAEAKTLRRGKRTVVVHVDVRDVATDRLAAVATISFMVLAPLTD